MRNLALVVFLCLLALDSFAKNPEEKALRDYLQKFETTWNHHDPKSVAAFWSEDGTLINRMGQRANGRQEIEKLLAEEFSTTLKSCQITTTPDTIRIPKPGIAFMDFSLDLIGLKSADGKDLPPRPLHVVVLAHKQGKDWTWLDARPYAFQPATGASGTSKN